MAASRPCDRSFNMVFASWTPVLTIAKEIKFQERVADNRQHTSRSQYLPLVICHHY